MSWTFRVITVSTRYPAIRVVLPASNTVPSIRTSLSQFNDLSLLLWNVDAPENIEAGDWERRLPPSDFPSIVACQCTLISIDVPASDVILARNVKDYTRHKINGADYPGIVPYSQSQTIFDRELELEERSVRGSLVVGLSEEDTRLLDIFEGNEYMRELVLVHPLGSLTSLDDVRPTGVIPQYTPPIPPTNELESPVEVNTYVWCRPLSELQSKLWTFEEFVEENAWKWVGSGSEDNKDYEEVDRRRAMDGNIVR